MNMIHDKKVSAPVESIPVKSDRPETTVELSIVAACMDRNDDLIKTVDSWLGSLSRTKISAEIIIVDWSSKESVQKTLKVNNIIDSRLIHVQVVGQSKWILSSAYNIGVNFASTSKNLLKLDCDTFIENNFFLVHQIANDSFYAGNFRMAETENDMHLNGVVMLPINAFMSVGGYDERIQTYGFDDDNLYERLVDNGYKRNDFYKGYLKHLQHNDRQRSLNQPELQDDLDMENHLNHAALGMLPKWTRMNQKTIYSSRKINNNHHVVSIDTIPPSIRKIIKQGDIDYIRFQYCLRKLKQLGLPKSMLNNRGDLSNYKKLLKTYSKGPMIIIDVQHGLGNRLRSLASAAIIAKKSGRHLRIIWKPDHHCKASFYDLFDKSQNFDVYDSIDKKELSNSQIKVYNYMEPEKGAIKYEKIEADSDKHIYVKSAYILSNKLVKETHISSFLKQLIPSEPVQRILDSYPDISDCIGVHVRNKSPNGEIKLKPNEYPKDGWNDLSKYRKASNIDVFIRKMQEIIDDDPTACFFVSADSEKSKTSIQSKFGTGRVWILEGSCDDRSVRCLHEALAELYILGRTRAILGSFWSSFSEVAGFLVGKRPLYAGKDFI